MIGAIARRDDTNLVVSLCQQPHKRNDAAGRSAIQSWQARPRIEYRDPGLSSFQFADARSCETNVSGWNIRR